MASAEDGAIHSFQKHIEDMRNLILCKICLKPFFEPYIISCGHSYCYGCLRSWFVTSTDRKAQKTCPDCRVTVREQPAPNYALRDMTHMFVGRTELLPEEENIHEHTKDKQDAAAELAKDREGPGLFCGVFKPRGFPAYRRGPIRDLEDNVDRCPICIQELEDGICGECGFDAQESEFSDESEGSMEVAIGRPPPQTFYGVGTDTEEDDSEDESNLSGPDEYDRHDDFVDDENEDDVDGMEAIDYDDLYEDDRWGGFHASAALHGRHRDGRLNHGEDEIIEEDEDEDIRPYRPFRQLLARRRSGSPREIVEDSSTNYDESEDEQETHESNLAVNHLGPDEDETVVTPRKSSSVAVTSNRRRAVVISDDEEDENGTVRQGTASSGVREETSGVEGNSDVSDFSSDSSDSRSDSGSEQSELSGSRNDHVSNESDSEESEDTILPRSNRRARPRNHVAQEINDTEESDEPIYPPQSRNIRQQRLQNQRARRPQNQTRASIIDLSTPPRRDHGYGRGSDSMTQHGRRGRAARAY